MCYAAVFSARDQQFPEHKYAYKSIGCDVLASSDSARVEDRLECARNPH